MAVKYYIHKANGYFYQILDTPRPYYWGPQSRGWYLSIDQGADEYYVPVAALYVKLRGVPL